MFNNLRYKSGLKGINILEKRINRKKFIYNLDTARKVGVILKALLQGYLRKLRNLYYT